MTRPGNFNFLVKNHPVLWA